MPIITKSETQAERREGVEDRISDMRAQQNLRPTNSAVLESAFEEAVVGPGTLQQGRATAAIEQEIGRDLQQGSAGEALTVFGSAFLPDSQQSTPKVSKDKFKQLQDDGAIPGNLEFLNGETEKSLAIRANRTIRQQQNEALLGQSTLGQLPLSITGSLGGSIVEPANLTAGVATAGLTRAAGVARAGAQAARRVSARGGAFDVSQETARISKNVRNVRRLTENIIRKGGVTPSTFRGQAGLVGAESVIGGVPLTLAALDNSEVTGERYTTGDAITEVAASAVVSSGLLGLQRGAGKLFQLQADRQIRDELARNQMERAAEGLDPDTSAIKELIVSQSDTPLSTLSSEQIENPDVISDGEGGFIARREDENGFMVGQVGRGATAEEARQNFIDIHDNPELRREEIVSQNIDNAFFEVIKQRKQLDEELSNFDATERLIKQFGEEGGDTRELSLVLRARRKAGETAKQTRQELAKKRAQNQIADRFDQQIRQLKNGSKKQLSAQINRFNEALGAVDTLVGREANARQSFEQSRADLIRAEEVSGIARRINDTQARLDSLKIKRDQLRRKPESLFREIRETEELLSDLQGRFDSVKEGLSPQLQKLKSGDAILRNAQKNVNKRYTSLKRAERQLREQSDLRQSDIQRRQELLDQRSKVQEQINELEIKRDSRNINRVSEEELQRLRSRAEEFDRKAQEGATSRADNATIQRIANQVERQRQLLEGRRDQLIERQRELHSDAARRDLQNFLRKRIDEKLDATDARLNIKPKEEAREQANEAPQDEPDYQTEAARSEEELRNRLQNLRDQLAEEDQRFAEQELNEASQSNRVADALDNYIRCRGKGNG